MTPAKRVIAVILASIQKYRSIGAETGLDASNLWNEWMESPECVELINSWRLVPPSILDAVNAILYVKSRGSKGLEVLLGGNFAGAGLTVYLEEPEKLFVDFKLQGE